MSGLIAEVGPDVQDALNEAASGGDGIYPPLPKGKYQAVVVPLDKDGTLLKVQDFGGNGPNSQKKVVRLAFKIVDESPTGKGRILFDRVPLFSRWAPKPGEAKGKTARKYFDFFMKALGLPEEQVLGDPQTGRANLPGPEGILGKRVTITISAPIEPQSQDDLDKYRPLGDNEIEFFDAPLYAPNGSPDVSSTPIIQPGVAVAAWLTPDNKAILPGYVFGFQKAQQAAQAAAGGYGAPAPGSTPAWATGGAPASPGFAQQPAAGGAVPGWGAQPAQPVAPGQVTQGPWGQPPAAAPASPGLQQAAAQAVGY